MCRHDTAANVHTWLVIDRSSSMSSRSVTPDSSVVRGHADFPGLDNALGVVYEAAHRYLSERASRSPRDLITFVPFNGDAHVAFAAMPVSNIDGMLSLMMSCKPDNGTAFDRALRVAYQNVSTVRAHPFKFCVVHGCMWAVQSAWYTPSRVDLYGGSVFVYLKACFLDRTAACTTGCGRADHA